VNSSRVPARGGRAVGCQQGEEFLAVRCQLKGQYGASGRNREGGRGTIANRLATTDKRAIARAFGTRTRPGRDRGVTNRGFPHQRYKPSKPGPTLTESPTP